MCKHLIIVFILLIFILNNFTIENMDENSKKTILGNLIKKERKKLKLSQDKFSELIGIDPTNLSKIERGISFPSFATFCSLIEVLKIEPNYFLGFINFEKVEKNPKDLELLENLKTLPDDAKDKINELILILKTK